VSFWTHLFFLAAAFALAGCSPCTSATTPINLPDGGPVRCVTAEDCPRTGNDLVCVQTSPFDYTSTCVNCVATACVRIAVNCP
jgi:hypothetical protein